MNVFCLLYVIFKDVFDTCDAKMLFQVNDNLPTTIIKFYLP